MTMPIVNIQKQVQNQIEKKIQNEIGICYQLQDEIEKLKTENIRLRSTFLERTQKLQPSLIPSPKINAFPIIPPEKLSSSTVLELIEIINNISKYVNDKKNILLQYKNELEQQNQELFK
jgi:hypothetical protein